MKKNYKAWQTNPESIDSNLSAIQYWLHGSMMTAQMKVAGAKEMVKDGRAFVISSQAIGAIE